MEALYYKKKKTTPIDKFDYTGLSSPVKDQTLLAIAQYTAG
jgi:hypothetical protein